LIPWIIEPEGDAPADLCETLTRQREPLRADLSRHGALLLRGFGGTGAQVLGRVAAALGDGPMPYLDRAAHRTQIGERVYTAADYPPSHEIFLHNESTYAKQWPMLLFLHCIRPAARGGETPIADVRRVLARLSRSTVRSFAERGVRYVRNFGKGLFGPSWRDAFQTSDRAEVDAYCRESGIEREWVSEEHLRTWQTRPALLRHPGTGEPVWFNHAATLHVSTLAPRVRRQVTKLFDEKDYPSNVYYGDGTAIEDDVLDEIRAAYAGEQVLFEWWAGDLLVVDNVLVAHGRKPFEGPREMAVVMSEPMSWDDATPIRTDEL